MTAHKMTWDQAIRKNERNQTAARLSKHFGGTRPTTGTRPAQPDPDGQLDLFGTTEPAPIARPKPAPPAWTRMTYQEQFDEFNRENPHVAPTLAEMAIRLKRKGHNHYSIDVLYGVLRYRHDLETVPNEGDSWKLNNNHRPYMARYLMATWPELDGFFEIRKLKGERTKEGNE